MIRIENFKALVDHICKKHGALLQEHVPKFKTLDMFFLRHQQNLEYEAFPPDQYSAGGPLTGRGAGKMARPARTRSPGREDSDDDESYFESEEDEPVVDATGPSHSDAESAERDAAGQDQDVSGRAPLAEGTHKGDGPPNGSTESDAALEQSSPEPALKGLLLGYDDDDDEDANADAIPPLAPASDESAGGGEGAPDSSADAVVSDADAATGDTQEAATVCSEEPAVATAVVEENGKNVEEHTSLAENEDDADNDRAPSAKAKAESRTLNHVVKRMKVNP